MNHIAPQPGPAPRPRATFCARRCSPPRPSRATWPRRGAPTRSNTSPAASPKRPGNCLPRRIGLHLDDAALRCLSLAPAAALHLLRGVEPGVGMARALVGELADAEHLGLQCRAHRVQKIRERPVARPLAGGSARGADPPQIVEVRLDRRGQLRIGSAHRAPCRRVRPDMQAPRPKQPRRLLARETSEKRRFGIGRSGWNGCRRRSGAASPRPASEVAGAARRRPRTKPARRRPGPVRGHWIARLLDVVDLLRTTWSKLH